MICRRCLQRSSAVALQCYPPKAIFTSDTPPPGFLPRPTSKPSIAKPTILNPSRRRAFISTTVPRPNAAAAAAKPPPASPEPDSNNDNDDSTPQFGTPLGDEAAGGSPARSSCPEGTVLAGLNYFKNKTDPVALADDAYPDWLWDCLEVVQKKAAEDDGGSGVDAGDEFSKSKKQRKLAAKRQRAHEAKLLAEGNIEALAPKIPLQQQSVNLAQNEGGTVGGSVQAVAAREELRQAMRRDRKARIKESNYLKSM